MTKSKEGSIEEFKRYVDKAYAEWKTEGPIIVDSEEEAMKLNNMSSLDDKNVA